MSRTFSAGERKTPPHTHTLKLQINSVAEKNLSTQNQVIFYNKAIFLEDVICKPLFV